MKQLFADFRKDDEEQKQLNFKLAKENLTRSIANNKKLSEADYNLLKENKYPVDDALKGGKTPSPVGDVLGVGGSLAAGYAAIKNPMMALGVAGAPNPNSPTFMNELSLDMVMNKGLPLNPFRGTKRIANLVSEIFPEQAQSTGRFFNQLFQKPNIVKQAEEVFSGRLFGVTGGDFPIEETGKLKKVAPTTTRDLDLYGATDDMFENLQTTSLNTALEGGSVRGGRFVKLQNATTGQPEYYTVFTRAGKTQILPYNTWYAKNVNPFMVPKALIKKLKKFEGGQQGDLLNITQTGTKLTQANPGGLPTVKIPVGTKGKFKTVVAPTKFSKGTVDEFNNWYKGVLKLQKEEQALNRQVSIMLEKLGNIQARNPGKKVFDTDLSHIAPRSKGGSGLTFQEAWILNQQRGAKNILDDKLLAAAGIPKNWEELFYYWLAQKKPGKELQTAIGPLSQINVDDYFALSKGEALNVVGKRRKDIRNLVNRQIGNKETYRLSGKRGTIQDDFEAAVRASKAGQVGGDIFLNDKLLDLRWVAENFDDLIEIGDI